MEPRLTLWWRVRWALRLRQWPWNVPESIKWIAWDQRLTEKETKHAQELAKKHGW